MAEFDFYKYVTGMKATVGSKLNASPKRNLLKENIDEVEDEDIIDDEDWTGADEFDSDEFEKEPSKKDLKKTDKSLSSDYKKREQLSQLTQRKDSLVHQLKAGTITIDQYKEMIGTIPQQIKTLTADLAAMTDVADDEMEMEDEMMEGKNSLQEGILSDGAIERMDGLVNRNHLLSLISTVEGIIGDLKEDGFEDDEIYEYITLKIKTLDV